MKIMEKLKVNFSAPQDSLAESLSALVDGELDMHTAGHDFQQGRLRSDWNVYQTIGAVLRAPDMQVSGAGKGADPEFLRRLAMRLEAENIVQPKNIGMPLPDQALAKPQAAAANDATFRWKMVAGLSSFGAAAVLAWSFAGTMQPSLEAQLAQNTTSSTERVVTSPEGLMVRDARLEELLTAHKQLGGTSLQAPSGFLRNAGFEPKSNGQR